MSTSLDPFVAGLDMPMFVVTAVHRDTGERSGCLVGFTAQSSIGPDRFVVFLSQRNHTHGVAEHADVLAVHGLAATQRDLAVLFGTETGDKTDKFCKTPWQPGPRHVPILDGCPRLLVGEIVDRLPAGNHTGFVLAPIEARGDASVRPLMFSQVEDLDAGHEA